MQTPELDKRIKDLESMPLPVDDRERTIHLQKIKDLYFQRRVRLLREQNDLR